MFIGEITTQRHPKETPHGPPSRWSRAGPRLRARKLSVWVRHLPSTLGGLVTGQSALGK